jgi:hypothetical protein
MRKAEFAPSSPTENIQQSSELTPCIEPRVLVDVLHMDILTSGLLQNAALARRAGPLGAVCIPHNWGSQVGGLIGLQLAKEVQTVPVAEDDRSTCDVLIPDGT